MTAEQLRAAGAIYYEQIIQGLKECQDVKLVMDEKRAYQHFRSLKKEYGVENAFVDFYYYRLDEESREMVNELLTPMEVDYLQILKPDFDEVEEEIIFPLDDKLLRIVVRLNAQEMLFSTIYFVQPKADGRPRTTWWGNYDQEYICLKDK